MAVFGADLWAGDWNRMSPQLELKIVLSRLAATHGGILLLHDTKSETAAMVPALLRALKADGYSIVQVAPPADTAEATTQTVH